MNTKWVSDTSSCGMGGSGLLFSFLVNIHIVYSFFSSSKCYCLECIPTVFWKHLSTVSQCLPTRHKSADSVLQSDDRRRPTDSPEVCQLSVYHHKGEFDSHRLYGVLDVIFCDKGCTMLTKCLLFSPSIATPSINKRCH